MAWALNRWEVLDFDPGSDGPQRDDDGRWMAITAPGDVYQALVGAGRLEHPFHGRGETQAAWVRDREWWWRTSFDTPAISSGERLELIFEGLDTFATIFLDGEVILRTDNMFRRYVVDISDRVSGADRHTLSIQFAPPALSVGSRSMPVWGAFTDRVSRSRRNEMRKAQFGWGWDWGPDLPTVGVWREVRLEVRDRARLTDVRFVTMWADQNTADLRIEIGAEGFQAISDAAIEVSLEDPEGKEVLRRTVSAAKAQSLELTLPQPRLWWTADLGDQSLYHLTVRLTASDGLVDEVRQQVGVRTIRLDQSPDPDESGTTFFRFLLNGVEIFAKGACWVPASSFVAEVDTNAYVRLIDQAVRANMNMIRVWGGGVYEPDLFHDLCDQRGLLVWQDFMFACAHYPEDEAFSTSVRAEVEDQVRRLRHHPSLALWCGNNESQAMHRINADVSGDKRPLSGAALYDLVIPEVLARLDPQTPYRPGSPWGGTNPNGMRAGDVHDWTVWHGVPPIPDDVMVEPFATTPEGVAYTRYAEDTARFVSEFGIQAAPAFDTLKRWMDPADLTPDSPGFLARIKDEARKADAMMETVTGPPTTIEMYIDFTQWTQAEGLKFGIEHFRRRRPHCSGALLWQFNDCWPCVSWSLVDYDGVEKAAYHAVRRAFAPVLASFKAEGDGLIALWITNDSVGTIAGDVLISLETFDGQRIETWEASYEAPAGGHAVAWSGRLPALPDRVLRVLSKQDAFLPNRHLFVPVRDLDLADSSPPRVAILRISDRELVLEIDADAYQPMVYVTSARPDLRYSDNHFDLYPGQKVRITVTAPSALGPNDVTVRWWTQNRVNAAI